MEKSKLLPALCPSFSSTLKLLLTDQPTSLLGKSAFSYLLSDQSDSVEKLYLAQVYIGSDLWVRMSFCLNNYETSAELTDATLADEDTSSILTDTPNRAIQVAPPDDQIWI